MKNSMNMTNVSEPVDAKCDGKNVFTSLISRLTVLVLMPRPAEGGFNCRFHLKGVTASLDLQISSLNLS